MVPALPRPVITTLPRPTRGLRQHGLTVDERDLQEPVSHPLPADEEFATSLRPSSSSSVSHARTRSPPPAEGVGLYVVKAAQRPSLNYGLSWTETQSVYRAASHCSRLRVLICLPRFGIDKAQPFVEGGPIGRMPNEGVFSRIVFECADGIFAIGEAIPIPLRLPQRTAAPLPNSGDESRAARGASDEH